MRGTLARSPRSHVALLLLLLAALVTLVAALGQVAAHAADSYRYWSFWEQKSGGSWKYATQGPSVLRPDDGDVLGFRFGVSDDSRDAAKPRGDVDFADVCGGTDARPGTNRIALTIDFGTAAEAPGGEKPPERRMACTRVGKRATAAEALALVAEPLRYSSTSLLCAVDGYPAKGCGEQIADEGGSAPDDGRRSGNGDGGLPSGVGIGAGVVVVAALGGAAVWQARRRRG